MGYGGGVKGRAIVRAALVGLGYLVAAMLSLLLSRGANGIAAVWPAGGLLLGALLLTPRREAPALLAAAAVASTLANVAFGASLPTGLAFSVANITESVIATALIRRWCAATPSFVDPRDVGRFCAAAILAGCWSALAASAATGFAGWGVAAAWFPTAVLGMLIVTPMILAGARHAADIAAGTLPRIRIAEGAALLSALAVVTTGVFWQSVYPALFLPVIALLAVTYRLGPFGAAAGVVIVACVGSVLTRFDHGPLLLIVADPMRTAMFFQVYLLSLFAVSLPLAALLAARARLTRQYARSERLHRLLADHSNDMIVRLRPDGVRTYVSPACRTILGYEPEELLGGSPAGQIHPDDRGRAIAVCRSLLEGAQKPVVTYRQAHRDGHYVWLEATYRLVDGGADAPGDFVASVRDVSGRRAAELASTEAHARMHESHRLLSMAERIAQVGHWKLDVTNGAFFFSPEVFRIHGITDGAAPSLSAALRCYHVEDRVRVRAAVVAAIATGDPFSFAARIVHADGQVRHIVSRGEPERGPDGSVLDVVGVIQDVTRQMETESALEAARCRADAVAQRATILADTDELTGVASRRRTLRWLERAIDTARAGGRPLSVAIFDIDHFKGVNDRFGHAAGDAVLRQVAATASGAVRSTDLVGRLGGEEFGVVLPGAGSDLAMTVCERIRVAVERGDPASDLPRVTTSVGVATLSDAMTAAELLHAADCALYAAKNAGRNALRLAA